MDERPEVCRGLCNKPHCEARYPEDCQREWIECRSCEYPSCEGCEQWECLLWQMQLLLKQKSTNY